MPAERSTTDRLLCADPAGAYALMDDASRQRYLDVVDEWARRSGTSAESVAEAALRAARASPDAGPARHVGHHLIGSGRRALEAGLGLRPRLGERLRRALDDRPGRFYFPAAAALTLALSACAGAALARASERPWLPWVMGGLLLPLALDPALVAVQALFSRILPRRTVPSLGFRVIPDSCRTLVAVPTLVATGEELREQLRRLERMALIHADRNLRFALLSDFEDAPVATLPGDEEVLASAAEAVAALNRRHADASGDKFFVLHRERRWSRSEQAWMGWERKRGKLEELNRLLREPQRAPGFRWIFGDFARACVARPVRYVVTLDDGSWLPRGQIRDLVRVAAHPLNQPLVDARCESVVSGYGIVQPGHVSLPRAAPTLPAGAPRYARLMMGLRAPQGAPAEGARASHDPAAAPPAAVEPRDVEFDVFGTGRYVGKGLYDVSAFHRLLTGAFPDGAVLSHDHLEGYLLRVAPAYGLVMFEIPATRYGTSRRQVHRWMRGDWQTLPWLLSARPHAADAGRRVRLPWHARLGLLRTLLAHVRAPLALLFLGVAWAFAPGTPWLWLACAQASLLVPALGRAGAALALSAWALVAPGRRASAALKRRQAAGKLLRVTYDLAVLPDTAALALDAAGRAAWRLLVSRRRLLEWDAHRRVEQGAAPTLRAHLAALSAAPAFGLAVLLGVGALAPGRLPWLAPLVLLWLAAPVWTWNLDRA